MTTTETDTLADLAYLHAHAFSFSLESNPHATFHSTVEGWLQDCNDEEDDDWVAPEQKSDALRTGKFIEARVYPRTSVAFFTVRGTNLGEVVRQCAACFKEGLETYETATPAEGEAISEKAAR